MVDRIYWIWQMLNPEEAGKIAGTITPLNTPASHALLTDIVYIADSISPPKEIQELLSITTGPFCYAYV